MPGVNSLFLWDNLFRLLSVSVYVLTVLGHQRPHGLCCGVSEVVVSQDKHLMQLPNQSSCDCLSRQLPLPPIQPTYSIIFEK